MLKMVDGTGIIGVDMICPLGVSTPQPPNYDRVELEGAGMLVLPNSLDAPLERLELGGKTEQVTTTGAQLFDANQYEGATKNGVTVTVKDGVITATGTANINTWIQIFVSKENYQKLFKPENKIYLKANKSKDCNYDFGLCGSFGSPIVGTIREGNSGKELPAELPRNDTDFYFFIDVKNGVELKGSIKPIVYHDGDGTWEPYTGGKPSPSPEYPQEIKNSGKWNEEKQKYEVDAKVTGKNLLNLQKEPDVKGLYQGWKVGNGDKGTLSIKDKGNNADISECYFGLNSDGTTSYSVTWLVDNGVIKRYHIESIEKMYACMYPPNETIIKKITERFEIQYEYGSIATEYQPYKEQTLTLTSDRPITKWDRLVEQGGQIGWLYKSRIAEIPKTGYALKNTSENRYGVYFSKSSIFKDAVTTKGSPEKDSNIFTHFKLGNSYASNGNIAWLYVAGGNTDLRIKVEDETINTVELFEQYISDKDIQILYETESTEFIPLPQSEQNAIRALKTYYPTTVITADGGELDPDIKATYRKEI